MVQMPPVYVCDNCRKYILIDHGPLQFSIIAGEQLILADFCSHQCAVEWVHEKLPEKFR